jgi:hypothetical protein
MRFLRKRHSLNYEDLLRVKRILVTENSRSIRATWNKQPEIAHKATGRLVGVALRYLSAGIF